jgi:hypothetical protein
MEGIIVPRRKKPLEVAKRKRMKMGKKKEEEREQEEIGTGRKQVKIVDNNSMLGIYFIAI